ncbi:MAG: family 16 glycoside hydrolase [Planctomycetota bacterium]
MALNGRTVVAYTEPRNVKRSARRAGRVLRAEGGAIALQAHDPKSTFYFKDIKIRKLD